MKYKAILRVLGVAVILSLLTVSLPATPALAYDYDIEISPTSGRVGDEITVTGDDWYKSTETSEKWARIYFAKDDADTGDDIDSEVQSYDYSGSASIGFEDFSDEGEFDKTITVPDRLEDGSDDEDVGTGTYYIYVTLTTSTGTSTRIRATAEFTVIGGEITLDPEEGPVGTELEITGSDFGDNEDIIIEYDGDEIDIFDGDEDTDSDGDFDTIIIIPESEAGEHTIKVTGEDSGSEVEATFTVEPEITVDPTSGQPGTIVDISGTGFEGRSEIIIDFDGDEIDIYDGDTDTDRDGSFETSIEVPDIDSDEYEIEVVDEADNSATLDFTVAILPTVSITPVSGHVDIEITASGTGLTPGEKVTVKYDDDEVASAIVLSDKTFSAPFKAPVSQHGEHTVSISNGITEKLTFTMESDTPSTPRPLQPMMNAEVQEPAGFDWDDVTDDSKPVTYTLQVATDESFVSLAMVLDKTGITDSEYTLSATDKLEPTTEENPYYWRVMAADSASNESLWSGVGEFFYTAAPEAEEADGSAGGGFPLPTWAIYLLAGLGALFFGLIGFWLGRRTVYFSY